MAHPRRLLWLALAASIPAFAQQGAPTPEVRSIGELLVVGKALRPPEPSSTVSVDALLSGRARTSDTASLLDGTAGISLYGAGGVSSLPAIHGLADDRVRIKVDGMDLVASCPNHMNSPLSYIDPTQVGSIKVFAGITPVSVGGDSLGGTIQVDSPLPAFASPGQQTIKGQAGTFYRSNGSGVGFSLGATLATETLSLTYSGALAQSDDYQAAKDFKPGTTVNDNQDRSGEWLAGNVVGSSRYKAANQALGLALRHENHLLELKWSNQDIPYEGYPNQRMDMTGNNSNLLNLRYLGQYDWGSLEARVYGQQTNHSMNFGPDKQYWYGMKSNVAGMPMESDGKTFDAVINANVVLTDRDLLRVGFEYQHYRLDDWWPPVANSMMMSPNTVWNINDGKRDRYDVFAEWEVRWNALWLSQLGIRSDTVEMDTGNVQGYNTMMGNYRADSAAFNALDRKRTFQNWDVTAVTRFTPGATQTYAGGYARKTRAPNLYELYTWSTDSMSTIMNNFVGDGNGYVGNVNLRPEVANTLSATADWHDAAREQWEAKGTLYYTYVQDFVDAKRCNIGACVTSNPGNLTGTTQFVNLQYVNQSARLYGFDLEGRTLLGKTQGFGNFSATGLASYVRGTNRTTGDNLYNIMPLNGRVAFVQQLSGWTNTAEVQAVGAKTRTSAVRNEVPTGGYALFNLRTSYQIPQARLDAAVENVFNRFYDPPLGGAYVGQGQTMSINGVPWGVPVPGRGRSFNVALTVNF